MKTYNSGSTVPLTCSEWGYADRRSETGISEQQKADYLARMFLMNLSQNISLTTWFKWEGDIEGEGTYGLVPQGTRAPLPAYYAAQLLTSSLKGETFSQKLSDGNSADWLLVFTGGGHTTLAAWTTGTSDTATVPGGERLPHLHALLREPDSLARRRQPGWHGKRTGLGNIGGELSETRHRRLAARRLQQRRCGGRRGPGPFGGQLPAQLASDVVPAYDGLDAEAIRVVVAGRSDRGSRAGCACAIGYGADWTAKVGVAGTKTTNLELWPNYNPSQERTAISTAVNSLADKPPSLRSSLTLGMVSRFCAVERAWTEKSNVG